jgi:hypothetical protein
VADVADQRSFGRRARAEWWSLVHLFRQGRDGLSDGREKRAGARRGVGWLYLNISDANCTVLPTEFTIALSRPPISTASGAPTCRLFQGRHLNR